MLTKLPPSPLCTARKPHGPTSRAEGRVGGTFLFYLYFPVLFIYFPQFLFFLMVCYKVLIHANGVNLCINIIISDFLGIAGPLRRGVCAGIGVE